MTALNIGPYNLRRGDRDKGFVYGGRARTAGCQDHLPSSEAVGYVRNLSLLLSKLGFRIVGAGAAGERGEVFGLEMELAVREFQIYARMDYVAQATGAAFDEDRGWEHYTEPGQDLNGYIRDLQQVAPERKYTGPVSGVVNAETLSLLELWQQQRYRCPVIVNAYALKKNPQGSVEFTIKAINLWLPEEFRDTKPRMFSHDFSGRYYPPGELNPKEPKPLGDYTDALQTGPRSVPDIKYDSSNSPCWTQAEIVPTRQFDLSDNADTRARQLSTFKVVRACAEQECIAYFDSINAYDDVTVSLGTCHWALGKTGPGGEGELAGFLAYFKNQSATDFATAFEDFGVSVDAKWNAGAESGGSSLFLEELRKYMGWLALQIEGEGRVFKRMPRTTEYSSYFKTWHWVYRLAMAGRTNRGFQRAMWGMTRIRLRDTLSALWPAGTVRDVKGTDGNPRKATIGEVFNSEINVALLLRWHIKAPSHVIHPPPTPTSSGPGMASNKLVAALRASGLDLNQSPDDWPPNAQAKLNEGLWKQIENTWGSENRVEVFNTFVSVNNWPEWFDVNHPDRGNPKNYKFKPTDLKLNEADTYELKTEKNSFRFDSTQLGPSPRHAIKELEEVAPNLVTLQFLPEADRANRARIEQALREFQIAAKMPNVARLKAADSPATPFAERFEKVTNELVYEGPVNGMPDVVTVSLIDAWKSKNWRCPVIIGAWKMQNGLPVEEIVGKFNISFHDEVTSESPQMFVRDYTGFYDFTDGPDADGRFALGSYHAADDFKFNLPDDPFLRDLNENEKITQRLQAFFRSQGQVVNADARIEKEEPDRTWRIIDGRVPKEYTVRKLASRLAVSLRNVGGPRAINDTDGRQDTPLALRPCWPKAEFLPQNILDARLASPDSIFAFKVIRAVAEELCNGFFDSIDASVEASVLSLACLKLKDAVDGDVVIGGVGAFLSWLRFSEPAEYEKFFGRFGLTPGTEWQDQGDAGLPSGQKLFRENRRRFLSGLMLQEGRESFESVKDVNKSLNYFRGWRWFYRFSMAMRTSKKVRRAAYDFIRLGVRELRATLWPAGVVPNLPGNKPATLGDVYRSEKSMALVLFWYLSFPEDVVADRRVARPLVEAYKAANIEPGDGDPTRWNDDIEKRLLQALRDRLTTGAANPHPQEFKDSVQKIWDWPTWTNDTPNKNPRLFRLTPQDVAIPLARLFLSEQRLQQQVDVCALPPMKQARAAAAAVSLGRPPAGSNRIGVLLEPAPAAITTFEALTADTFDIAAVVLTIPGTPERGLRLPLKKKVAGLRLKVDKTQSPECLVYDRPQAAPQALTFFELSQDPANPQPVKLSAEVDLSPLEIKGVASLEGGVEIDLSQNADGNYTGAVRVELAVTSKFLRGPLRFVLAAQGDTAGAADLSLFSRIDDQSITFKLPSVENLLKKHLPLDLVRDGGNPLSAVLTLGFDEEGAYANFQLKSDLSVELGSPLAQLHLGGAALELHTRSGLDLSLQGDDTSAELLLNIFSLSDGGTKIIDNAWGRSANAVSGEEPFKHLFKLKLKPDSPRTLDSSTPVLSWRDSFNALVHSNLLASLTEVEVNPYRKLQSFAGDVLGRLLPAEVTFAKAPDGKEKDRVSFAQQPDGSWRLHVPLRVAVKDTQPSNPQTILEADGGFNFKVGGAVAGDYVSIAAGDFHAEVDAVTLKAKRDYIWSGGDLISLHIPEGAVFKFTTDPRKPSIEWDVTLSQENTRTPIGIRVPASVKSLTEDDAGHFTFVFSEFFLTPSGFDISGEVRSENVDLNSPVGNGGVKSLTGFQQPLAIKGVERSGTGGGGGENRIGEIRFRQSKLVYGSLQASAKLTFFDDATGTFRLALSQDPERGELSVIGTLDITGLSEFHVDDLYMTFQIDVFHLETRWSKSEKWNSTGSASGRVKFLPARGGSASDMGELSKLFEGVVVEFEEVDPVKMGFKELTVHVPPKTFELAKIFKVEIRGFSILPSQEGVKKFKLLGDVTLQKLPVVDTQLTFGGITLSSAFPPRFRVHSIGADISLSGGFHLQGSLEWIDNEAEFGLGGTVSVESESLPKLDGLFKLTRVNAPGGVVPSLAVYLEMTVDEALVAGFFLRRVGFGLGIYQVLDGLKKNPQKPQPLQQRIMAFVDNPAGLPNPGKLSSWVPNPPADGGSLNWMYIASGVITFGKLPPDQEHALAGTILLALDEDFDLVAGVNIWLFASPNDTSNSEYIRHPAARGAIGISPREKKIFGYFRTVKNPKVGKTAPPMLAEVLSRLESTLMFVADSHGFLYELGWPWDSYLPFDRPPLSGECRLGFRFGIYRGIVSYGQNFAVTVTLNARADIQFNTPLGNAGAVLTVFGQAYFRCSFMGALDHGFKPYLLGDVRLGATVLVTAEAFCELSIKICFVRIRLRISFHASFSLSISAALMAGVVGSSIGFDGNAEVAVSVCGYRLAGRIPFRLNEGVIPEARANLDRLMPSPFHRPAQSLGSPGFEALTEDDDTEKPHLFSSVGVSHISDGSASKSPAPVAERAAAPDNDVVDEEVWHYRFLRTDGTIRVLLFPRPGLDYTPPNSIFHFSDKPYLNISAEQRKARLREEFARQKHALSENFTVEPLPVDLSCRVRDDAQNHSYLVWHEPDELYVFEEPYDAQAHKPQSRFNVKLKHPENSENFLGFLGSDSLHTPGADGTLNWDEGLTEVTGTGESHLRVLLSTEKLLGNSVVLDPDADLSKIRPLTLRGFLDAFHESTKETDTRIGLSNGHPDTFENALERVDPRTVKPVAAQADDETHGIAPEGFHSPYLRRDHEYDEHVTRACPSTPQLETERLEREKERRRKADEQPTPDDPKSEGLSSSLLFSELLTLLKDQRAQPRRVDVASQYTAAPYLNLMLVFKDTFPKGNDEELYGDWVPELLDLRWDGTMLGGSKVKLQPVTQDAKREYDLTASEGGQSASEVALMWELKLENQHEANDFAPYAELDSFTVFRANLNRPDEQPVPIAAGLNAVWGFAGKQDDGSANAGKDVLVRPQFQLIDNQLSDVAEGDLLQYRLSAKRHDRKTLAECSVNVLRSFFKPVPAPAQAVFFHKLENAREKKYVNGQVEIAVSIADAEGLKGPDGLSSIAKESFRLRYRYVPIALVGFYGFEHDPKVVTDWVPGLPPETHREGETIEVKFGNSDLSRPLQWEDTLPVGEALSKKLEWTEIFTERRESNGETHKVSLGFRARLSEEDFWKEGRIAPPPGSAVEFYFGLESQVDKTNRSRLIRCRHAIRVPVPGVAPDEPADNDTVPPDYLGSGNTVDAIERIPVAQPELAYVSTEFTQASVSYENEPAPDRAEPIGDEITEGLTALDRVRLHLKWRHTPSAGAGDFNPVAGYKVYRLDGYDPEQFLTADGAIIMSPQALAEANIRAIPEALYRAFPDTIEVRQSTATTPSGVQAAGADWRQRRAVRDGWKDAFHRSSFNLIPDNESGPIWLHESIKTALDRLKKLIKNKLEKPKVRYVLTLREPLEDRGLVTQDGAGITPASVEEELARVSSRLGQKEDAAGWLSLEALGLACEFRFEEEDKQAVSPEFLRTFLSDKAILDELFADGIDDRLHLLLFVGQDGRTLLNVMRLAYIGPLTLRDPLIEASLVRDADVTRPDELARRLKAADSPTPPADDPFSRRLVAQFLPSTRDQLKSYQGGVPVKGLQDAIRADINKAIEGKPVLGAGDRELADKLKLNQEATALFARLITFGELDDVETVRLNRSVVESAYKGTINPRDFRESLKDDLTPCGVDVPLGIRCRGRESKHLPESLTTALGDRLDKQLEQRINTWLADVKARASTSVSPVGGVSAIRSAIRVFKREALPAVATPGGDTSPTATLRNVPGLAMQSLPFNREGLLRLDLRVPDQWARTYLVALEVVRRYDRLWEQLSRTAEGQKEEVATRKVPFKHWRSVHVMRSLPLAPQSVLATPLSGSVQGLVFAHPAAFAAAASALNAARGQYSGQTVFLQRRINPIEHEHILALFKKEFPTGHPPDRPVDWSKYQTWLRENGFEPEHLEPKVTLLDEERKETPVALQPVEGTGSALYGADRYVFPDLPAYYEYRIASYVTAGRTRSPLSISSYVAPLYDSPEVETPTPRQFPHTKRCRSACATEGKLTLRVLLLHPRYYMRKNETRNLWVGAEEVIQPAGEGLGLGFGSLPDLYTSYQLYLLWNYFEVRDYGDLPLLVPLARIIAPMVRGQAARRVHSTDADSTGFELKSLIPSVDPVEQVSPAEIVRRFGDNYRIRAQQYVKEGAKNFGGLFFGFKLNYETALSVVEVLSRYTNFTGTDDVSRLIFLNVERDGVLSKMKQGSKSEPRDAADD